MPENTNGIMGALNGATDETGRLTCTGSIKLGHGVQGVIVNVKGKKTLVAMINLDHKPLPISDGQTKYANEHRRKDGSVPTPVPYVCKANGQLSDIGMFVSIAVKPAQSKAQAGDWE